MSQDIINNRFLEKGRGDGSFWPSEFPRWHECR